MYHILLVGHSWMRWLALVFLLLAIFRSGVGLLNHHTFSKFDNALRHWTATLLHIQLLFGMLLLVKSPIVQLYWSQVGNGQGNFQLTFFGLLHPLLMLAAIVVISIGSAKAKRKALDREKFRLIFIWYTIVLLLLILAIPWSFSPFVARPDFRVF